MARVLTVAVINYETADLTAACVRSVLAAPPSEPCEVVVVDNGSSEATLAPLRALEAARLVETGVNGGFAVGVNRCLAEADPAADAIVVLNSDTEVTEGALDELARAVRRDGVGLAAPLLLERDGSVQLSAFDRMPSLGTLWWTICLPAAFLRMRVLEALGWRSHVLSLAEHEAGARPANVTGAAMAFRREAWDAVGPFDERFFMYFEESEWQRRLHAAGWAIELVATARVRHLHRGGEVAILVPPLTFFDGVRTYFRLTGRRDVAVRATLVSALAISWAALALAAPLTRWLPSHRPMVIASRASARRALVHVLRGRFLPRPSRARVATTGRAIP